MYLALVLKYWCTVYFDVIILLYLQTGIHLNSHSFPGTQFVTHSSVGIHVRCVLAISLVRMRRNSINSGSHCACAVSRDLSPGESKNGPHFWNPWARFTYSLCYLQGATTKIKACHGQKIAFSHYEGYKVYCACAGSRNLCIGGPPKPHVTIFWPRIAYSLYNFYAATMTIKGSLY